MVIEQLVGRPCRADGDTRIWLLAWRPRPNRATSAPPPLAPRLVSRREHGPRRECRILAKTSDA